MAGQKEYEVELQFTSGLLSSPVRLRTGEENIDGEKAVFGSRSDLDSHRSSPMASSVSVRSGNPSALESSVVEDFQKSLEETDATDKKPGSNKLVSTGKVSAHLSNILIAWDLSSSFRTCFFSKVSSIF